MDRLGQVVRIGRLADLGDVPEEHQHYHRRRDIDGGGGLANPALLIGNCKDPG